MSTNNTIERLTPQSLYKLFEQEMKKETKKETKSSSYRYWIKEYAKSQLLRYYLLLLLLIILLIKLIPNCNTIMVLKFLMNILIPLIIFSGINRYFEIKKSSDKNNGYKIIKNILKKEIIVINKDNLEKIIKNSVKVGSEEKKEWELVKKSKIIFFLQKLVNFNMGIVIGFLGNAIIKEGIYRFNDNFKNLFYVSFLIILIIIYSYDFIYFVERNNSYYYDLYIEILKDKQFVFSLER